MYAIITLKDISNLVCPEPLAVIRMDMENQGSNMLVFPDAGSGFSRKMLVISASVDIKNPTECFDAVLETQLMNGI